jgi:hypothetical protein
MYKKIAIVCYSWPGIELYYLHLQCIYTGVLSVRSIHRNQFKTFKNAGIPVV